MKHYAIVFDASGSVGPYTMEAFRAHATGVAQRYTAQGEPFMLHVFSLDTVVHNYQTFDHHQAVEGITSYDLSHGGGGTSLGRLWAFLKNVEVKPDQLTFFTDTYDFKGADPHYCPTTFVLMDVPADVVPPFGTVIRY
jgi:hypothetical protein